MSPCKETLESEAQTALEGKMVQGKKHRLFREGMQSA